MKHLFNLFLAVSILSSCCAVKPPKTPANDPPLSQVVSVIQDQYARAVKDLKDKGINVEINEADLSLQISKVSTVNAGITVAIFNPTSKYVNTRSMKVTYILKKEKPEGDLKGGGKKFVASEDNLHDLIVDAATKFAGIDSAIGELTKDSFSLDIVFSIEWDNTINLAFKIFGQGATAGYEYDHTVQHELVLTFNPIKPK